MKAMLRNAARRWASKKLKREADDLRRELVGAQARIERQEQANLQAERALHVATTELVQATATINWLRDELEKREDQIQRQADMFEQSRAEMARLRRERDAALAKLGGEDEHWSDVAAVSGPEAGPR